MLSTLLWLTILLAPLSWFFYEKLYKLYLDCQVPLQNIDSVLVDEKEKQLIGETAVIVGGSFSGLTTAIVLSKYYKRVIIVDRSKMIPDESIAKSRQGEQAHVIAYRSMQVWDRLLPGFLEELNQSVRKNKLNQIVYPAAEIKYHYKSSGESLSNHRSMRENPMIMASRGQIETILRERVRKELKNVEIYDGYSVSATNGIKVESSVNSVGEKCTRVKSVTITKVTEESTTADNPIIIDCDLFVNCAGANSASLMKNLENEISPNKKLLTKSSIECKIRYQTILVEPKESSYDSEGKVAIYRENREVNENRKLNDPYYIVYHLLCYPNRRGILIMPHSNNQYLILLGTYNEKIDSITYENAKEKILEFSQFSPAMERDTKLIMDNFKDTPTRIAPVYEKGGSEYVHYENLKGVKDFIAVGDSCGSLNPIYGQGVTMAVDSAVLLDDLIKKELSKGVKDVFQPSFCQDFQSRLCKSYLVPWLLCSTTDMRFDFAKYTSNLEVQKMISPIMGWLTDRMFKSSNVSSLSSYYFMKALLMEDGFRKELINLRWIIGCIFWKEAIALTAVSLSIYLATLF